jgi:hypothetical protein
LGQQPESGASSFHDYSETSLLARCVRDEIREVADGLYLGRVFWKRRRIIP